MTAKFEDDNKDASSNKNIQQQTDSKVNLHESVLEKLDSVGNAQNENKESTRTKSPGTDVSDVPLTFEEPKNKLVSTEENKEQAEHSSSNPIGETVSNKLAQKSSDGTKESDQSNIERTSESLNDTETKSQNEDTTPNNIEKAEVSKKQEIKEFVSETQEKENQSITDQEQNDQVQKETANKAVLTKETDNSGEETKSKEAPVAVPNIKKIVDKPLSVVTEEDEEDQSSIKVLTKEDVDLRAQNAPKSYNKDFKKLIDYLMRGIESSEEPDVFRYRVLLAWLGNQDVGDDSNLTHEDVDSPETMLERMNSREITYATAFAELCSKANLECEVVSGYVKAGNYEPGDDVEPYRMSWNSIRVGGKGYIVHPAWACTNLVGQQTAGWVNLESDGTGRGSATEVTEEVAGDIVNAFNEYYLMPDPAEIIYCCIPDDPKYQYLKNPWSMEMFKKRAYVDTEYFLLGMKLTSKDRCHLESKKGKVEINLKTPKQIANMVEMNYELYIQEKETKDEENYLLNSKNMPRLVTMIRNGTKWSFRIQLPKKAVYKFVFYGGVFGNMGKIAEFRIDCNAPKLDCKPLPIDPGTTGFGPGPQAEMAGLYSPSHRNGIYSVNTSRPTIMTFYVKEPMQMSASIKTMCKNNETGIYEAESRDEWVRITLNIKTKQVRIVSTIGEPGDFALSIATGNSVRPSTRGSYMNNVVCNYLFSSDEYRAFENREQRHTKKELMHIIEIQPGEGITAESLIHALNTKIKECLDLSFNEDDEDVEVALNTVQQIMVRHQDILSTFRQNHSLVSSLQDRVKQAREDQRRRFQERRMLAHHVQSTAIAECNWHLEDLNKFHI